MDMKRLPRVGCVVMAAGSATRFGGNKLAEPVDGVPLIRRALLAVPAEKLCAAAVVTQYGEVAAEAAAFGFDCVENDRPGEGVSRTIRLGVEALEGRCDAILFQVADQPLLRRETVAQLVDFYMAHPDHIVGAAHDGVRGNPCIFPARFFGELKGLAGDTGGSAVIRHHSDSLLLCEVPEAELADVDTPAALAALDDAEH